jgi:hypothetical protein
MGTASFVEQATLLLKDKSSGQIKKINSELRKLDATAKLVKKSLAGINFNIKGLSKATSEINRFATAARKAGAVRIAPSVDTGKIKQASAAITSLRSNANKPINVRISTNVAGVRSATGAVNRLHTLARRTIPVQTLRINRVYTNSGPGALVNPRNNSIRMHLDDGPLRMVFREIGQELASAIVSGVKRAFASGFSEQDIADTRLSLLNVDTKERKGIDKLTKQMANDNPVFSQAQYQGLAAEALPVVKGRTQDLGFLLEQEGRLGALLTALGKTPDEAREGMTKYIKAGEQSGRITNQQGFIDPKMLEGYTNALIKATVQIGRELTPELVEKTLKSARSAKYTLDDSGLAALLLAAEEQGSTAGVGVNQMIKNLTGGTTKEKVSNQVAFGLQTQKEIEVGRTGGKKRTELVAAGSVDEEMLRENPLQFVGTYIIPAMRKAGFDPNNATSASKFSNLIAGDRTAAETLTGFIKRYNDLLQGVQQINATKVDREFMAGVTGQSGLLAFQSAGSQIVGLAGTIADSFEKYLIPAMNGVAMAANALSDFIKGDEAGKGDPVKAGLVTGGGIAGALALLFGGKKIIGLLNPLNASAVLLSGAATQLNVAALALQGAAGVQGVRAGAVPVAAGKMGRLAGVAGILGVVTGLYQAVKNSSSEGRKDEVKGAKSFADTVTRLLFGDKVANDPTLPANQKTPESRHPEYDKFMQGIIYGLGKWLTEKNTPNTDVNNPITAPTVAQVMAIDAARKARAAGTFGNTTDVMPGKLADDFNIAFSTGADKIETGISNGIGSATTTISGAFQSGAATIAAAITNALAAGVKVNVNQGSVPGKAPLDTGGATLGHR